MPPSISLETGSLPWGISYVQCGISSDHSLSDRTIGTIGKTHFTLLNSLRESQHLVMKLSQVFVYALTLRHSTCVAGIPTIPSSLEHKNYRVQRSLVPAQQSKQLLRRIAYDGVETDMDQLNIEALNLNGDRGARTAMEIEKEAFAKTLQDFISFEFHANEPSNHSLIYFFERLELTTREKNQKMVKDVVNNTVMEDGGTIHLYISAPGLAALDNHTDTTDIVVLQLDGEKEWLLCQDPFVGHDNLGLRSKETAFNHKLGSCSTYNYVEVDELDCERTVLYPGDALFLPRRIVHSARAPLHTFSAHLTFGYIDDALCRDFEGEILDMPNFPRRDLGSCNINCQKKCDGCCDGGCDNCCDGNCWMGCDSFGDSCDTACHTKCDTSCDNSCDCSCSETCECAD